MPGLGTQEPPITEAMGLEGPLRGHSLTSVSIGTVIAGLALSLLGLYFGRVWWRLRHIPGPFPGNLTNFLRVKWVTTKRAHLILQEMHEKYGEVVRIGPNTVSFSNPEAIPSIYTARTGFPKVGVPSSNKSSVRCYCRELTQ